MRKDFAGSIDEGALMEACYETASRTVFDSEPESSKLKQVADKFFEIAKQYEGAFRGIVLRRGLSEVRSIVCCWRRSPENP
jgi:hypothetical protein